MQTLMVIKRACLWISMRNGIVQAGHVLYSSQDCVTEVNYLQQLFEYASQNFQISSNDYVRGH
jgi:hypothetical protein